MDSSTLQLLSSRRSVAAKDLSAPGPSAEQLHELLAAAHRVPDHGKLGPWRFVVFEGEARAAFGRELTRIYAEQNPNVPEKVLAVERGRLTRAPLVIAVVANIISEHKIPEWEQMLAVGACCQNLIIAANAQGFGAQWLTEWYSYNEGVDRLLELETTERLAGFIYVGSYSEKPSERKRPSLEARIRHWHAY